jgi:hypothetical protein
MRPYKWIEVSKGKGEYAEYDPEREDKPARRNNDQRMVEQNDTAKIVEQMARLLEMIPADQREAVLTELGKAASEDRDGTYVARPDVEQFTKGEIDWSFRPRTMKTSFASAMLPRLVPEPVVKAKKYEDLGQPVPTEWPRGQQRHWRNTGR